MRLDQALPEEDLFGDILSDEDPRDLGLDVGASRTRTSCPRCRDAGDRIAARAGSIRGGVSDICGRCRGCREPGQWATIFLIWDQIKKIVNTLFGRSRARGNEPAVGLARSRGAGGFVAEDVEPLVRLDQALPEEDLFGDILSDEDPRDLGLDVGASRTRTSCPRCRDAGDRIAARAGSIRGGVSDICGRCRGCREPGQWATIFLIWDQIKKIP